MGVLVVVEMIDDVWVVDEFVWVVLEPAFVDGNDDFVLDEDGEIDDFLPPACPLMITCPFDDEWIDLPDAAIVMVDDPLTQFPMLETLTGEWTLTITAVPVVVGIRTIQYEIWFAWLELELN